MPLRVGNLVRMNPKSGFAGQPYQGNGGMGRIADEDTYDWQLPIKVVWFNGERNCYAEHDLINVPIDKYLELCKIQETSR